MFVVHSMSNLGSRQVSWPRPGRRPRAAIAVLAAGLAVAGWSQPATGVASSAPAEPAGLAPDPLAEATVVRVAAREFSESFAPVVVGEAFGEFAKENIEIEFVTAGGADIPLMLSSGEVDVGAIGLSAGLMNGTAAGSVLELVAPNHTPNPDSKAGLWVTDELAAGSTDSAEILRRLEGEAIGSAVGPGTVLSWVIDGVLATEGLGIDDVELTQIGGGSETLLALQNGAVPAAWVLDPFWVELEDMDIAEFVAPQPSGIALGGYFMSERLLVDEPDVGLAFVRALTRTVRTALQGDYHEDPEVVEALAAATGQPLDSITGGLPMIFDPDMTLLGPDEIASLQDSFRSGGVLSYEEPLPYDALVEPAFVEAVLG